MRLFFCYTYPSLHQLESTVYAVKLGNHRVLALIILAKKNKISLNLKIGKIDVKTLVVSELVRLYNQNQLATLNTNFRGIPWIDESKVEDIVNNFSPEKLFDQSRDGGVGVELHLGGSISYQDIKVDYGHGDPLPTYLRKKWGIL